MKKYLILYYSHGGHTENFANELAKLIDADLMKIKPQKPYDYEYKDLVNVVLKEDKEKYCPEIKNDIEKIDNYDTIFLGSPTWCGTFAAPIRTVLKNINLTDKVIIPFGTNGGGGFGKTITDYKTEFENINLLKGYSKKPKDEEELLNSWLKEISIIK
ncbi:MAG: flavodoxin [Tissierellia bacterium]|nr:flavodoxin [Tissierellia bacterium]